MTDTMTTTALSSWYGSFRMGAPSVGIQLGRLKWCGVPFVGGGPELPHIQTAAGVATDLHRHLINLARVVRDDRLHLELIRVLEGVLFHPDELASAQRRCLDREARGGLFGRPQSIVADPDVQWAADYFMASWMGRGGHSGKKTEFKQNLAVRWTSSGGDSARRFQSAISSLRPWHAALKVWSFELLDAFDFLDRVKDEAGHGLYIDAPWPEAGDEYKHAFTDADQIRLAKKLRSFVNLRIVIRFGDHPFIRELYPETYWKWLMQTTRTQQNTDCAEALIINGPPFKEAT